MSLQVLIAEAVWLAGGSLCAAGHDWQFVGGRYCEHCGSQPVYQCARCDDYDYGEPGGPAWAECEECQRRES